MLTETNPQSPAVESIRDEQMRTIHEYCAVVTYSNDPERVRDESDKLTFFWSNEGLVAGQGELHTPELADLIEAEQKHGYNDTTSVQNARLHTLTHSLRALVCGSGVPSKDVPDCAEVIISYADSIVGTELDTSGQSNRKYIRSSMYRVLDDMHEAQLRDRNAAKIDSVPALSDINLPRYRKTMDRASQVLKLSRRSIKSYLATLSSVIRFTTD